MEHSHCKHPQAPEYSMHGYGTMANLGVTIDRGCEKTEHVLDAEPRILHMVEDGSVITHQRQKISVSVRRNLPTLSLFVWQILQ
ncbi:hypothetical protein Zmor_001955 [Zophobas morio]|uniref:Uncharacterized protein n=1 Tax=Zophobas morio TaxID=2755281 RepID=A0AA38MTA4_9CUCU|nr:hypothetical protein Zmor_001955 [Zophobas morio]